MRSPAQLRAAAQRAGMRVESLEYVPTPDGRVTIAGTMSFSDPWDAARYLVDAAEEDGSDPIVRQYALALLSACRVQLGEPGPTRSAELLACTAEAIQRNVQEHIVFLHEPKETFQSARETLALGAGDCDDHARLVVALGIAANIPGTELVFWDDAGKEVRGDEIQKRHGQPEPVHVAPTLAFEYAETTIGADFGENPYEALERLEVETGENPMAHAPIGALRDDVVQWQTRVADQSTRLSVVVEGCKATLDAQDAWSILAARALSYASADPDTVTVAQGVAIITDMNTFGDELRAAGCSDTPPPVPVPAPSSSGGEDSITTIAGTVKTVAIVVGVVAVALLGREVVKAARA